MGCAASPHVRSARFGCAALARPGQCRCKHVARQVMDPYKLLGVSASSIKHESDLIPARKRAKTLYKRYSADKKKFDAKKVLEAFEIIKRNFKGKLGEGQNKILGRSR